MLVYSFHVIVKALRNACMVDPVLGRVVELYEYQVDGGTLNLYSNFLNRSATTHIFHSATNNINAAVESAQ